MHEHGNLTTPQVSQMNYVLTEVACAALLGLLLLLQAYKLKW